MYVTPPPPMQVAFLKDLSTFWQQFDERLLLHKILPPIVQVGRVAPHTPWSEGSVGAGSAAGPTVMLCSHAVGGRFCAEAGLTTVPLSHK
jgi:hypothetical protein